MTLSEAAMAIESSVTVTSVVSIQKPSPQLEFHRHFDDDVDRRAVSFRRREAPLAHGLDGALVQTCAQALEQLHRADAAVAPDDDLEHHVAFQVPPASFLRVIRLYFALDGGRRDSGA